MPKTNKELMEMSAAATELVRNGGLLNPKQAAAFETRLREVMLELAVEKALAEVDMLAWESTLLGDDIRVDLPRETFNQTLLRLMSEEMGSEMDAQIYWASLEEGIKRREAEVAMLAWESQLPPALLVGWDDFREYLAGKDDVDPVLWEKLENLSGGQPPSGCDPCL